MTWPPPLYNPQPQADDVLLPLPCGGAMTFRAVPTPGRDQGYPVTGPFERPDGTPYLLVGKYEVSALQAQALAAPAAGRPCPPPQGALQVPQIGDWWEALELADRYSLWLMANAETIPACDTGTSPCLPRVDAVPAYLRLPTATEWEYAARGGLSVPAESFAAPRYPLPGGLGAHAWYADNAQGTLHPIGGRAAGPLGLHDLYGNAAEWVLGSNGPAALVVGGHAGSPAAELGAGLRWAPPPFAADPGARTGLRLLASVPLFTTPEKVRESERRRLVLPAPVGEAPPPITFLANLRITTDVPAEVLLNGQVIGKARPGQPFESQAVAVGEREVGVRAQGYKAAAQMYRFRTRQWVDAGFRLTALLPLPEMIDLPGGEFWMGSPPEEPERFADEGPRHKVRVRPFSIGKYAVTFAQYDAFAEATGRTKPSDAGWGRDQRPVVNVGWGDAVAYAQWLSAQTGEAYRLPSEAEWEYVVRAGSETAFWTGRCIHTDQANYDGNNDYHGCGAKTGGYCGKTVPVGSLPANPWGLHEVLGNVWEWVQDHYHDTYAGAPADGGAWESGGGSARVSRGGSWFNGPRYLRSAVRSGNEPDDGDDKHGFRLAKSTASASGGRVASSDAATRMRAGVSRPVADGDSLEQPTKSTSGSTDRPQAVSARDISKPGPVAQRFPYEPETIVLPGGEYWMGSPPDEPERNADEGPRHRVRIAPFAIGKTEVTFVQYDAFCEATGRAKPSDRGWGRDRQPVINVSWDDAVAYTAWLSIQTGERYRLPSEAEWEYAARAGTETPFWAGPCIDTDRANYDGRFKYHGCEGKPAAYRERTVSAESLPANPWGLHEVSGNVREWVLDTYHESFAGAPGDGSAWEGDGGSERVSRGGSWSNFTKNLRSANRFRNRPDSRINNTGFRVVRSLSPGA